MMTPRGHQNQIAIVNVLFIQNLAGPKKTSLAQDIPEKKSLQLWILGNFENLKIGQSKSFENPEVSKH